MVRIEDMLAQLNVRQRRPFISLYCVYNKIVPAENKSASWQEVLERYNKELALPSSESLVTHLLLDMTPHWTIDQQRAELDYYFDHRNNRTGFRVPALLEAGICLQLAERYRSSGDSAGAKSVLTFAADNFPIFRAIQILEEEFDPEKPIDWGDLLLPNRDSAKS